MKPAVDENAFSCLQLCTLEQPARGFGDRLGLSFAVAVIDEHTASFCCKVPGTRRTYAGASPGHNTDCMFKFHSCPSQSIFGENVLLPFPALPVAVVCSQP